jgi:pimeloyl-ACP methyl ester carboxylesterase
VPPPPSAAARNDSSSTLRPPVDAPGRGPLLCPASPPSTIRCSLTDTPPVLLVSLFAWQAWSIKAALDSIGVKMFGLVGVSYGGFMGYRMAAIYPDTVERVALVCAGVCLEEKDLADGLFPVSSVDEAATLLVWRRPDEVRRLVKLTFVRSPPIMPSCFLWD